MGRGDIALSLAWGVLLLTLAGCMRSAPSGTRSHRSLPERPVTAAPDRAAHERMQQKRVRIPETPVDLTGDYAMPPHSARQSFLWGPYDVEWRATFINHACEFIGFHLRRPLPVPDQRRGMYVYFELWPPELAHSLALGLRDRPGEEAVGVVPIAHYRRFPWMHGERAVFVIPLEAFDEAPATRSLDWNTITGVHLVRLEPTTNTPRQIVIAQLQLVPLNWVRQLETIRAPNADD
jgi:hypothetical protein